jgi:AcrR family transcriptional regulator
LSPSPTPPVRKARAPAPADLASAKVETREREIKAAAVECIRKLGARKVAVEDIAKAAGISRRTFYRFFSGRRAVMEAVVLDRLRAIADGMSKVLSRCRDFEEAVVIGSLETMRMATADKIYSSIVEEDHTLMLEQQRGGPEGPLEQLFMSNWAKVFEAARADGVLRSGITDHEAAEWIMDMHRLLILREDLGDEQKANVLRKFVLPSLTARDPVPTRSA